jgi:hypothetical protein
MLKCWNTMPTAWRCAASSRGGRRDHPPALRVLADQLAVEHDVPGRWDLEMVDASQQRRLTGALREEPRPNRRSRNTGPIENTLMTTRYDRPVVVGGMITRIA